MTSLHAQGIGIDGRLADTDLSVEGAQLVALVGPNGGGKTSLLRALARIDARRGTVTIGAEPLDAAGPARRRQLLSFLPASKDVVWPIAARDVISLGLEVSDGRAVRDLIDALELGDLADRPVNRLSTGERSRVLFARALVARPRILLLDEPMSNLDPYWVLRFLDLLRRSVSDHGQLALVALHDLAVLDRFDRALLVADGRVQMDETPASLMASERFRDVFRVEGSPAEGFRIRRPADPRSSP